MAVGDVLDRADQADAPIHMLHRTGAVHPQPPAGGADQRQFQVPGRAVAHAAVHRLGDHRARIQRIEADPLGQGRPVAGRQIVQPAGLVRPGQHAAGHIHLPAANTGDPAGAFQKRFALAQALLQLCVGSFALQHQPALLQPFGGDPGQLLQGGQLRRLQRARALVDHAHRAHAQTVGQHDRRAGVITDPRRIGDQRVVAKARIGRRIAYFHHRIVLDGVGAERELAWGFAGAGQADIGLPPLTMLVHQRHQRDRRAGNRLRGGGQRIEERLGIGIDDLQQRQTRQPIGFAGSG